MAAMGALSPRAAVPQGVAISESNITIARDNVLTIGHAAPLYARGTGRNNLANRLVKLGDTVLVDDDCSDTLNRGLTLSLFDALGYVSSTNYDTWGSATASDELAGILETLGNGQIGVLTSCDAFESENTTANLRAQARRLGLGRLAMKPGSTDPATWRHPYAAIFYGSPDPISGRQALEILQPNTADAPHAVLATWLMDDGFVGQALPEARPDPPCFNTTQRFVDCGNGTVADTASGLIYLKNANCFGEQDWPTANESAAALAPGQCGLSDNSRPGDWRLQTEEEWDGILDSTCTTDPEIVGNGTPLPGCYGDAPANEWASGVVSSDYWSSTTDAPWTARFVMLSFGGVGNNDKLSDKYVWPVRDGQ
jgi:hypothetical protein